MRPRPGTRAALLTAPLALPLLLTGCGGGATDPAGRGAHDIATGVWIMLAILVPLYVVVAGLLVAGLVWRPEAVRRRVGGKLLLYVAGIAVPLVLALTFFAVDVGTGTSYAASSDAEPDVVIRANMWWWDVEYVREGIRIANELRIPTGRDITVELRSDNVIHSLWIPRLQGKMDAIPGEVNRVRIRADEPGIYRGQCAEFCGLQHANMALLVVAYRPADYRQWVAARRDERTSGPLPAGLGVALGAGCRWCHTISGTLADGRVGPDLTHIGNRLTLGAGTVENTRANLARWIADPGSIKPGVLMPAYEGKLSPRELAALVEYLESLR